MFRVGIDLGGTKIAGVVVDENRHVGPELRRATPVGNYRGSLDAIAEMVGELRQAAETGGVPRTSEWVVGVGLPGSVSPRSNRIQNANSTWLNGQSIRDDLERVIGLPVRVANDANCFALSEATDGAAADGGTVFGVIIGTGVGGAIVVDGRLIDGPRGIGGEWGHNPLPWPDATEVEGPPCWCGQRGCIETWLSGPGLIADYNRRLPSGSRDRARRVEDVVAASSRGSDLARASLEDHIQRLARSLAMVVNIVDPDVIVIGGGLSNLTQIYERVPIAIGPYVFADDRSLDLRPPKWGDASGVRGAARLWPWPE